MSNTIDYSDYHIYKKEEIKERAKSLECHNRRYV